MHRSIASPLMIAVFSLLVTTAVAQTYNNIPSPPTFGPTVAPLPPPPAPTPSPLGGTSNSIGPSSAPSSPPSLDTYGDRVTRCLDYGASRGLSGGDLGAYSRSCANN